MKTTPVTPTDLQRSVLAVPPLCRDSNLAIDAEQNALLVRHLEAGGVRTLLYGGNANLYNIAVSEYPRLLELLEGIVAEDTWIIPSVGPFFGTILDQAACLADRTFPTAMILPTLFPASDQGIQVAVRRFVEVAGIPAGLYIKDETYIAPGAAAELVDEGVVTWIKYAVVRDDPAEDPYLEELVERVDRQIIVSGIGEQPTVPHFRDFGIRAFTSGCVCVRPDLSMEMLRALSSGDFNRAEEIAAQFRPLENLRNDHGPIPVLHHAVSGAQIAETGPQYPLLSALDPTLVATIAQTAGTLLDR